LRGLPAPPSGVIRLALVFDIDGRSASVGQWFAVPGLETHTIAELRDLVASMLFYIQPWTTSLTHRGCSLVRVDLKSWGTPAFALSLNVADNHGAWTGGQLAVGCTVLRFITTDNGRGMQSLCHLPGFPDQFTDDHMTLNGTGFTNAHNETVSYLNGVQTLSLPGESTITHGVVHVSEDGAPLATATFSPTLGIVPARVVGTLDRRRTLHR